MAGNKLECVVGRVLDKDRNQFAERLLHGWASVLFDDAHPGPQWHKRKSSPNRDVNDGDAAVRTVHRAEDMKIFRQEERVMKRLAEVVGQIDLSIGITRHLE